MLSRIREWLTLVLIALLPFHALLVTVITKIIAGPGHAPLGVLAVWKEAMVVVILLLACLEVIITFQSQVTSHKSQVLKIDTIDVCILLGILYAIGLEILHHSTLYILHSSFLLGFKYDFLPLVAFFILRRVSWSAWFQQTVINVLLAVGAIVALYGIATFFLPMSFFTWLGYSDLHSLYQAQGHLAAFQQIGGSTLRRIQSTMSGPNQLGVWLLIPLGVLLVFTTSEKAISWKLEAERKRQILMLIAYSLCLTALALTFSRASWIGAGVMVAVMLWQRVHRKSLVVWWFTGLVVLAGIAIALAPQILIRKQSLIGHIEKPLVALQTIIAHPFGLGLGSAGPASNRTSDTCIDQPVGSDISWAKDRQDLCIFIGGEQVQPTGRACSCPVLTENWYLQWGVEMGWLGLFLSVLLPIFILKKLQNQFYILHSTFYIFLAVYVASVCRLAWEDSAVALTV